MAGGPLHQPTHILVVEDDIPIASMVASILRDDGYEVDLACNGQRALEMIGVQDYSVILTDLRMPELDGVALYRALEQRQPDLLRRLIVITGTSGHPEYETFLEKTRLPYLEKPFSLHVLLALVHKVLSASCPSVT
jgi:two-component system NtrC family sensor kinase